MPTRSRNTRTGDRRSRAGLESTTFVTSTPGRTSPPIHCAPTITTPTADDRDQRDRTEAIGGTRVDGAVHDEERRARDEHDSPADLAAPGRGPAQAAEARARHALLHRPRQRQQEAHARDEQRAGGPESEPAAEQDHTRPDDELVADDRERESERGGRTQPGVEPQERAREELRPLQLRAPRLSRRSRRASARLPRRPATTPEHSSNKCVARAQAASVQRPEICGRTPANGTGAPRLSQSASGQAEKFISARYVVYRKLPCAIHRRDEARTALPRRRSALGRAADRPPDRHDRGRLRSADPGRRRARAARSSGGSIAATVHGLRSRFEVACWRSITRIGDLPDDGLLFANVSPATLLEPELWLLRGRDAGPSRHRVDRAGAGRRLPGAPRRALAVARERRADRDRRHRRGLFEPPPRDRARCPTS